MPGRWTKRCIMLVAAAALSGCAAADRDEPTASAPRETAIAGAVQPDRVPATAAATAARVGPSLHVLEDRIDLGTHTDLDMPTATVVFRNMGDATLELHGPTISGVNTAGFEPIRIEPLGTRSVDLTMDLSGMGRGVHERSVAWRTNDPRQQFVKVTVVARVRPIVSVEVRPVSTR